MLASVTQCVSSLATIASVASLAIFAEADSEPKVGIIVLCSIISTALTFFGMVGPAGKYFLNFLSKRAEEQRLHDEAMMDRFDVIVEKFDTNVRDGRNEQRSTIDSLLGIQRETTLAVSNLGQKVGELGKAIVDLRVEVTQKMDKPK